MCSLHKAQKHRPPWPPLWCIAVSCGMEGPSCGVDSHDPGWACSGTSFQPQSIYHAPPPQPRSRQTSHLPHSTISSVDLNPFNTVSPISFAERKQSNRSPPRQLLDLAIEPAPRTPSTYLSTYTTKDKTTDNMHGSSCPKCGAATDGSTKTCGSCGAVSTFFSGKAVSSSVFPTSLFK